MSEKTHSTRINADWLVKNGWRVYFNSKNNDGYPLFHADCNSKPDLLATRSGVAFAVEIKTGNNHSDLLNGFDQTLKYAGEYYTGRVTYRINYGTKIAISAFVFATQYSGGGFLYARESTCGNLDDDLGYLTLNYDMAEKPITHTFTRLLWREWTKGCTAMFYEHLKQGQVTAGVKLPETKPHIGILIAKITRSTNAVSSEPYLYLDSNNFKNIGGNSLADKP